ncbi:MAG: NAD(P)H dehydrogenase (quinone) [Candidatus Azotimanducaceae bacterium]|jgi:NAD(P)H dehydrogenase (quinone)|tara:strand:- start:395 stop:1009 length:615 start_codon:yes stop_codon:yes gene_type:complete
MSTNPYILILYYSRTQGTQNLALHMGRGVDKVAGIETRIRTVPPVSSVAERTAPSVPDEGAIFCTKEDLAECSGLALGSATRFGNMAAPMKYFLDSTADLWAGQQLVGKPASVFCSTGSLHGGQESTLLTMMVPLLHHGMVIQGLPYSHPELNTTQTGGTPYGVTHVQGKDHSSAAVLSKEEAALAEAAGQQLAELALKIRGVS